MALPSEREERFLALLRPVHSSAERYAVSLSNNRDEARDIFQDAIIIMWQKFDALLDKSAFKSYLFTVITNQSRHYYRRNKRFQKVDETAVEEIQSASLLPDRITEAALVKEALQKLPQKSREALVLFELHDLSIEEISKLQRSSISAVKVRLMRARRMLAARLNITQPAQLIQESR